MSVHTADDHLQAGRALVRLAFGNDAAPRREDHVHDPKVLQIAEEHFDAAASLFKAEGRPTDEASVRIDLAEVYLKMPLTDHTCAAAEASCRAALDLLDTAEDPATSLRAYVLFVEAMTLPIGHAPDGAEKEERIKRTLGVLRGAEYLATEQNDPTLPARIHEAISRVRGEQFSGDRDANLLEAIRAGYRALPEFYRALAESPLDYPSLQAHIGNCYMKLDGPRMRWLREGLAAYKDGLAVVDRGLAPRLHRVLTGNVAMVEALIAAGNGSLPEKEMMMRFGAKLQFALDGGDVEGATAAAWDTVRWAWSLDQAPNVWVAEAHKLVGTLLLQGGDTGQARDHFYSAAALLSALGEPGGRQHAALLDGARQLLREAMARLGQADQMAGLLRQADSAFAVAREHSRLASQLVANDPKAAHEACERALALFPYDPLALFCRGLASLNLSHPQDAREDFDRVLALQPLNLEALVNRARARTQVGDTDGAFVDYAAVLKFDPRNVAALYNRSALCAAVGDREAAIEQLDQLIAVHPDVTAAHALRAKLSALESSRAKEPLNKSSASTAE